MLHVRDTMEIEDRDGNKIATVKKALITPLRDRWTVKVADGPDLEVKGNILDHEYTIEDGRTKAAEVSKKWFRVADTYGVEVAPGQEPGGDPGRYGRPGHHGPPGALSRREGVPMGIELNHTIVRVRDKRESAHFLAEILGLGDPGRSGRSWPRRPATTFPWTSPTTTARSARSTMRSWFPNPTSTRSSAGSRTGGCRTGPTRADDGRARSTPTTAAGGCTGRIPAVTSWRSSPGLTVAAADSLRPAPVTGRWHGRVRAAHTPTAADHC